MAVVAADRLVELANHVVELLGVHAVAFRIHQSGELGRFACNAVCKLLFLLRARRFFYALKRIQVTGRLVVAQRERVSLVHGVERRIRFQVVLLARIRRVRRIVHVARVLVRIDIFPRFGGHHAELVGLGRGMLGGSVWRRHSLGFARSRRRRTGDQAYNQRKRRNSNAPHGSFRLAAARKRFGRRSYSIGHRFTAARNTEIARTIHTIRGFDFSFAFKLVVLHGIPPSPYHLRECRPSLFIP